MVALSREGWRFFGRIQAKKYYPTLTAVEEYNRHGAMANLSIALKCH